MRCGIEVNKSFIYRLAALVGIGLGAFAALTSVKFAFIFAMGLLMVLILLADYEKATWLIGIYLVIDYVIRKFAPIPLLASSWDELFFVFCIGLWFVKWFFDRKRKPYQWTPLDFPLLLFIGVSFFLLLANSPDLRIGIDGLRAVVQYMFWYFVVVQLLKSQAGARRLYYILVALGTLIGLHGIYQYIIGVEIPPNWVDAAESSIRTRVFSIIGSPNMLGSLMVLLIPMALTLVYYEHQWRRKLIALAAAGAMTLCLLFTFSRGAWLGFAVAIAVLAMLKDRRLLLPMIICGVLVLLFVPSVADRITYLLSPEYLVSSSKGGRLLRWAKGLDMVREHPWLGVGLGRFGGAVAMNNKQPGITYFYMDNYYLKTAVEMGLTGLFAFLALVYSTIVWGLRGIQRLKGTRDVHFAQGALAGICGVLVHNFVENIFEVPMIVTYFWTCAAIIMILAYSSGDEKKAQSHITE